MLKYVSLVTLTLQNAVLILVMRYVRVRPGDMFLPTTAVIMSEMVKSSCCLVIIFIEVSHAALGRNYLKLKVISGEHSDKDVQPWRQCHIASHLFKCIKLINKIITSHIFYSFSVLEGPYLVGHLALIMHTLSLTSRRWVLLCVM